MQLKIKCNYKYIDLSNLVLDKFYKYSIYQYM